MKKIMFNKYGLTQAEITKQELIEKSVSLYSRSLTEVINMLIKIGKSAGCEELGSIIKFDDSVKIFREKLEE